MPTQTAALFDAVGAWRAQPRVAIGFSGGADSVFLALAWRAYVEQEPRLEGVETEIWVVDHEHAPDSGHRSERAARLAEEMGFETVRVLRLPKSVEVPEAFGSGEQGLRWRRYACFAAEAAEREIESLFLGHQADDQAETVLMRILRGTGIYGLAGIPATRTMVSPGEGSWIEDPRRRTVVRRPLLTLRRREIRDRLRAIGQPWLADPSNHDPLYATRNGLRLQALPMLSEWSTGDPIQALLRVQREAADWKESVQHGVRQLIDDAKWIEASGPERRKAIEVLMRAHGHTATERRTAQLEQALLRRGSAALDDKVRLTIAGGPLQLLPRRDAAPSNGEESP